MSDRARRHSPVGGTVPHPCIVNTRFSTRGLPRHQQALAWRDRVGHVIDMLPSREQLENGLGAEIRFFSVSDHVFTDASTDAMVLDRSLGRVSKDSRRDIAFHLYVGGATGRVSASQSRRSGVDHFDRGIVAFDLGQTFKMERPTCRVLTVFIPRAVVDAVLVDGADSIHGRIVPDATPLTALIFDHIAALAQAIPSATPAQAVEMLDIARRLLIEALGVGSKRRGSARSAVQAAIIAQVRRHIDAHLDDAALTPASVVDALGLKRATVYRWFEDEGGLATVIRNRRLRAAANDLIRFPHMKIVEIAFGLGFKSASDFARAFRRAFDMSPLDMRVRALDLQHVREWDRGENGLFMSGGERVDRSLVSSLLQGEAGRVSA